MNELEIMMMVEGEARGDLLLTADRIYYRFVTEDTLDEGELPPVDNHSTIVDNIISACGTRPGEKPTGADIYVKIKAGGQVPLTEISEQGLRRTIDLLTPIAPEFAFLYGFRN